MRSRPVALPSIFCFSSMLAVVYGSQLGYCRVGKFPRLACDCLWRCLEFSEHHGSPVLSYEISGQLQASLLPFLFLYLFP